VTVKSRDGQTLAVKLNPNWGVVAVSKAAMTDIKQGHSSAWLRSARRMEH
jgi:hypothetical protein